MEGIILYAYQTKKGEEEPKCAHEALLRDAQKENAELKKQLDIMTGRMALICTALHAEDSFISELVLELEGVSKKEKE